MYRRKRKVDTSADGHDHHEENLIKDYEKGELTPVHHQQAAIKQASDAARRYLRRESRKRPA